MWVTKQSGFRHSQTDLFVSFRAANATTVSTPENPHVDQFLVFSSQDFQTKFSILNRKIDELEQLVTKRSRPTFDTNSLILLDHDIRTLTAEITTRIGQLRSEIKRPINPKTKEDASLLLNFQQSNCIRLGNIVKKFRLLQASKKGENMDANNDMDDPIASMYADFEPELTPDQVTLLHRNEEEIRSQNDELARLVTMMNELNELFRDLSLIVFEQGTVLDRIDTKIEVAIQEVESGNEQLRQANNDQKSKCFYVYIGIVAALIITCFLLLIFRHK